MSSADTTTGLISKTVDLGTNFDVNKQQSTSTLRFIATGAVVYNNATVIAAGAKVPFYSQMQNWVLTNSIAEMQKSFLTSDQPVFMVVIGIIHCRTTSQLFLIMKFSTTLKENQKCQN